MKRLNVIVPLSRPLMIDNVRDNFERQRYQNKRLVIVQNGPGLCACQRAGFQPDVLIDISKAHQSTAKNSAGFVAPYGSMSVARSRLTLSARSRYSRPS